MKRMLAALAVLALSCVGAQAAATTCTDFRKAYSDMVAARIRALGASPPQGVVAYYQALKAVEVDMSVYLPAFTRSASAGCLEAEVFLGSVYVSGMGGLPPDRGAALAWFTRASADPRSATSVYAKDISKGLEAARN